METPARETPIARYATWRLDWRDGQWTSPDGTWHRGLSGTRPDIAVAHEAVDAWADAVDITAHVPRVAGYSVWWTLRFCLVHEYLGALLPHLRALQQLAATSPFHAQQIVIPATAPDWWRLLPQCLGLAGWAIKPSPPRDPKRAAARVLKGAVGEWRLRQLLRTAAEKPRVLAVSRANAWSGATDRELGTAIDALESMGFDVVVMEQSHGPLASQLDGWRTRPARHLLGDFVHLRQLLNASRVDATPISLPNTPLMLEGTDISPLLRDYVVNTASAHAYQHDTYVGALPSLLKRLGIRGVLLTDENGAEHGLKVAALEAGLPVVAVQHGCIHADHMSYIFPARALKDAVPLPTATCVYGLHEQDLLNNQSVYAAQQVEVTGQVANDTRPHGVRPWGKRGAKGDALRGAVLPKTCDRLLLLTSQDLLHHLAAERLLPRLRESPDRYFLVVRPHPREEAAHWENYFESYGVRGRACVSRSGSLDEWMDACDAHVSVSSTALSEAIVWGRPNILVGDDVAGDWLGVLDGSMAVSLEAARDLDDTMRMWEAKLPEEIEQSRKLYLERHFHLLDGNAGKRIANVLGNYLI